MTLKIFFSIVEIRTKIVSLSTFLLFHLWLWSIYGSIHWELAILSFFAILAVDMGTTAFNSYYDFKNQVDDAVFNRETDKVLVHQQVRPFTALGIAWILYGIAGFLGLFLVVMVSPWLLPLGLFSLMVGFLYSGGPKPLSFTPFGEPIAGFFLGSVLWLFLWFIQGSPGDFLKTLFVSLPSTCLIAGILAVNNLCDREGDSKAGRKTFAIVFGQKFAWIYLVLWVFSGFLLGLIGGLSGLFPLNSLVFFTLGLALSVFILHKMNRIGFHHGVKGVQMQNISKIFLVFTGSEGLCWFFLMGFNI